MNFVPLAIAAAAGFLGYKMFVEKKEGGANPSLGQAEKLEMGKSYTVIHATNGTLPAVAQQYGMSAPELIKKTMENAGFAFLSNPTPKDPEAASNFQQGKDTAWVYNVKRTTPEEVITAAPPTWSGMMQFYKLPTA